MPGGHASYPPSFSPESMEVDSENNGNKSKKIIAKKAKSPRHSLTALPAEAVANRIRNLEWVNMILIRVLAAADNGEAIRHHGKALEDIGCPELDILFDTDLLN